MIYTGLRIEELLSMNCKNVFLPKKYMTGGLKTDVRKDHIIPISDKIFSFVSELYCEDLYLVRHDNKQYSRPNFLNNIWNPTMKKFKMKHFPHDTLVLL